MTTCKLPICQGIVFRAILPSCAALFLYRCPWTGTGVGRKNMLAFKVFVVGINVLCYFSVILVIVALLRGLRY